MGHLPTPWENTSVGTRNRNESDIEAKSTRTQTCDFSDEKLWFSMVKLWFFPWKIGKMFNFPRISISFYVPAGKVQWLPHTQRGEHEEIPHLSPGSTTNNDNNAQLGIAKSNALQCVYYMIHIYIIYIYNYIYNVSVWLVWGLPPKTILVYWIIDSFFARPPQHVFWIFIFTWFQFTFNWHQFTFNWFQITFNWFSIYFRLISIYFQLISIFFQFSFNWFQFSSIEINLLSIDFNLLSIEINLLSIDFNLLSIDFNLLSIDFNLFSIDFNLLSRVLFFFKPKSCWAQ